MGIDMTIRSRTVATSDELARVQSLVDGEAPPDGWQCIEEPVGHLCQETGASADAPRYIFYMPKVWLSPLDSSLGIGSDDVQAIHSRSADEIRCMLQGLEKAARELQTEWRVGFYQDWVGVMQPTGPDQALSRWLDALRLGQTPETVALPSQRMRHWQEPWDSDEHRQSIHTPRWAFVVYYVLLALMGIGFVPFALPLIRQPAGLARRATLYAILICGPVFVLVGTVMALGLLARKTSLEMASRGAGRPLHRVLGSLFILVPAFSLDVWKFYPFVTLGAVVFGVYLLAWGCVDLVSRRWISTQLL